MNRSLGRLAGDEEPHGQTDQGEDSRGVAAQAREGPLGWSSPAELPAGHTALIPHGAEDPPG